jgi:23S rRNA (adenine2503-C2)-methyltransferase
MTDLPKDLRTALVANFAVFSTRIEKQLIAADKTHKLVLRLQDDRMIECVLIQDEGRSTACISTQVGCGMGCVFCASGLNGVVRNLTAGEILEQLVRLRNRVGQNDIEEQPSDRLPSNGGSTHPRLTHIVVMGMGEPLANLDRLLEALTVAGDKNGLGIGARHITISTVGLPAKIRRLAELGKQYHLAVSLHAPNDPLRTRIVPPTTRPASRQSWKPRVTFSRRRGVRSPSNTSFWVG